MVVVALLSVDLVESVDLVSVELVVNCIRYLNSVPCFYLAGVLSNTQDNLKEEDIVIWW